jgi:hypothetical protein
MIIAGAQYFENFPLTGLKISSSGDGETALKLTFLGRLRILVFTAFSILLGLLVDYLPLPSHFFL